MRATLFDGRKGSVKEDEVDGIYTIILDDNTIFWATADQFTIDDESEPKVEFSVSVCGFNVKREMTKKEIYSALETLSWMKEAATFREVKKSEIQRALKNVGLSFDTRYLKKCQLIGALPTLCQKLDEYFWSFYRIAAEQA